MSSKPVLGYWNIRGLAHRTRLLLAYLGVDYEDKRYEYGQGPNGEVTTDSWLAEKFKLGLDFPNVPYWIDDDVKLTESRAIFHYVAQSRGPHLYPEKPSERAVAHMIECVASDVQNALVELAYSKTGVSEIPLEKSLAAKFEQLQAFMANRKYVLGEKISFVDFYLYEVLVEFHRYNKEFLTPYPRLKKYVGEIESIPEVQPYIKASEKLPCYSPFATLQF